MAQTIVNTFSPQTPIGQGLQNLAIALFANQPTGQQKAEAAALAEQRRAAARHSAAAAELDTAKAENERAQIAGRTNLLPNAVASMVPQDYVAQVMNFLKATPSTVHAGGVWPRPSVVTPDAEGYLRNVQKVAPFAMASSAINPDQLAKASGEVQAQSQQADAAAGRMPMARYWNLNFKPTVDVKDHQLLDLLTGALGAQTDVGKSVVAENRAQANSANAAAGAHSRSNPLVETFLDTVDANGNTVRRKAMVPTGTVLTNNTRAEIADETEAGRNARAGEAEAGRNARAGAKGGAKPMTAKDKAVLSAKVDLAFKTFNEDDFIRMFDAKKIGGDVETTMKNDAVSIFSNGEADTPRQALEIAADRIMRSGNTDEQRNWLSPNVRTMKAGATPAARAPASTPATMAADKKAAAASKRPAGKTDDQLIQEANAAIKAGKDPAAVRQRLKDWGVQVQDSPGRANNKRGDNDA